MMNDNIQDVVYNFITKSNKGPCSFLLCGNQGIEKVAIIQQLIAKLLKTSNIKTHPNLLWIDASQAKLTNIRNISDFMYKTRYYPDLPKIITLNDINHLNIYSFNALLKILEEPTQSTYFLLMANNIENIPETIRSRNIILKFSSFSYDMLYQYIKEKFPHLSKENITQYLSFTTRLNILYNLIENNALSIYEQILNFLHEMDITKLYKFIEKNFTNSDQLEIFYILIKNLIHKIIKSQTITINSTISIENKILTQNINIQQIFAINKQIDIWQCNTKIFGLDSKIIVLIAMNKLHRCLQPQP